MINKIRENWDLILDIMRIEHDISPVAFNTWIKPLTVYSVEGHTITILVNNELEQMCSYIKKKFEQPLKVSISEYFNDVYDIHITTSEELGKIEATQTVEPEKKPAASIITTTTSARSTAVTVRITLKRSISSFTFAFRRSPAVSIKI